MAKRKSTSDEFLKDTLKTLAKNWLQVLNVIIIIGTVYLNFYQWDKRGEDELKKSLFNERLEIYKNLVESSWNLCNIVSSKSSYSDTVYLSNFNKEMEKFNLIYTNKICSFFSDSVQFIADQFRGKTSSAFYAGTITNIEEINTFLDYLLRVGKRCLLTTFDPESISEIKSYKSKKQISEKKLSNPDTLKELFKDDPIPIETLKLNK